MTLIYSIIATCGGIGLLKPAPGTYGSLLALPIAFALHSIGGAITLISATIIITIIGTYAAHKYAQLKKQNDPQAVIIDEVAGQCLTLCVVPPEPLYYLIGFILFRIFDITKPFPINLLDQKVKGGIGIMADDIAAAIYAATILLIVSYSI